jgi:hypothetical protein
VGASDRSASSLGEWAAAEHPVPAERQEAPPAVKSVSRTLVYVLQRIPKELYRAAHE